MPMIFFSDSTTILCCKLSIHEKKKKKCFFSKSRSCFRLLWDKRSLPLRVGLLQIRPGLQARLSVKNHLSPCYCLGSAVIPRTTGPGILRGIEESIDAISQKCQGRRVIGHGHISAIALQIRGAPFQSDIDSNRSVCRYWCSSHTWVFTLKWRDL